MENNLLRIVLLVILFFLLTSDYPTLFKQIMTSLNESENKDGSVMDSNEGNNVNEDGNIAQEKKMLLDDLLDDPNQHIVELKSLRKDRILNAVKNSCLPKLICELNAAENKENLSQSEINLLNLIRDTSISDTAEVTSKYHFAAHMGQLISGVEGTGCHNFYPDCPIQRFRANAHFRLIKSR